jgi:endonuclease G
MKLLSSALLSFFLAVCAIQASAATSACPSLYAGGQAPDIINTKLNNKARELCSTAFVVMHSGVTRTPLWSAELITKEHVLSQRGMKRENTFHPDERLSASERSELQDYLRSGYDRGHMVPSASMWTPELQHETFALSNMIPQNSNNNQHLHASIETAVRNFARKAGRLYVITGPLFQGAKISWLHSRVAIPTHVFKLVYDPQSGRAAAYLEENADGDDYKVISASELEALAGINFLPGVKVTGLLSLPTPRGQGAHAGARTAHSGGVTAPAIYAKLFKSFK